MANGPRIWVNINWLVSNLLHTWEEGGGGQKIKIEGRSETERKYNT
jgi:hypothetical protein